MDNLIITFNGIGEGSLYIVDDKTYDTLYAIYENQEPSVVGYSKMMEKFMEKLEEIETIRETNIQRLTLQWNSHDHLESPVTFKRILQLLME